MRLNALPARVEQVTPAALAELTQAFADATTPARLERAFELTAPAFVGMRMFGIYLLDPVTDLPERVATGNVSDVFVDRYERHGRGCDPVLRAALASGLPAYSLDLMSADEMRATRCYRDAGRLHDLVHVVEAPIFAGGARLGTVNFGDAAGAPAVTAVQLQRVALLARLLGLAAGALAERERLEARNGQLMEALDLTGTAVAILDPAADAPIANRAARALLERLGAGEELLYDLTVPPGGRRAAFTRVVELRGPGGTTTVRVSARPSGPDRVLVATLTAEEAAPAALAGPRLDGPEWALLTPRERDVALLLADGLSDREIATRLVLSTHTVRQHAKRIYHKLGVSSRVQLMRLALGAAGR